MGLLAKDLSIAFQVGREPRRRFCRRLPRAGGGADVRLRYGSHGDGEIVRAVGRDAIRPGLTPAIAPAAVPARSMRVDTLADVTADGGVDWVIGDQPW
jgi:hypothetical protein